MYEANRNYVPHFDEDNTWDVLADEENCGVKKIWFCYSCPPEKEFIISEGAKRPLRKNLFQFFFRSRFASISAISNFFQEARSAFKYNFYFL